MSKPTGKISKELALEIAAIAGDAGARAAVEAYKKESEHSARERADRRPGKKRTSGISARFSCR